MITAISMMKDNMRRAGEEMSRAQTPEGKAQAKRQAEIQQIARTLSNIHDGQDMCRHFRIVFDGMLDLREASNGRFRFRLFNWQTKASEPGDYRILRNDVYVVTNLYQIDRWKQKEYLAFILSQIWENRYFSSRFQGEPSWKWSNDNMGVNSHGSLADFQHSALNTIAYRAREQGLVHEENLDGVPPARRTIGQVLRQWGNNIDWRLAQPTTLQPR